METLKLKRFAQYARRSLIEQVSAKLKLVLSEDSAARRESVAAVKKLEEAIHLQGKDQVIERVAYIWFNRFCALRFMDVNRYNRVGIVSPADPGQFQPEILAEAKMGHIDDEMVHDKIRQQIFALLDGKAPSRDPQGEAYRLLVVAACNYWNKAMPFLFERIEDYTELLMPDDMLSGNSILAYTREAMTPDVCEDVEVIGWLYQFYISEKKDEVFDGLKKNKKITPENIPAATQLFTPHWIVRYLVENSLGRLWLLNRPSSKLAEQMNYYIKSEQTETDFLRISKPEEIKICDPACGSGHILTYAFDLLYAIYEEEGYEPAEIPEKILSHNLYGIEIDERAGELAAFALTMKARAKQRRFFNKEVKPNICVLENVHFDGDELKEYMDFVGRDLFTLGLENTLRQFEEADNFGSLIRPDVTDVNSMLQILESKNVSGHLFLSLTHQKVVQTMRQADYLSPKYHVVIANPPYMSQKGMNQALKSFSGRNYKISKSDLFSMFIERATELAVEHGLTAMVTIQNWMFLSSFENLRNDLLAKHSITSLVQIGFNSFPELNSKIALACAFVVKTFDREIIGSFVDLNDAPKAANKEKVFFDKLRKGAVYLASDVDFKKIPGSPIAFSVSQAVRNAFAYGKPFKDIGNPRVGMQTSNNDKFLRLWHEISYTPFYDSSIESPEWIKYVKGGPFRRWYGNLEYILHYRKNPSYILSQDNATVLPLETLRLPKATWTDLTLIFGARLAPTDSFHDISGHCFYPDQKDLFWLLGYSNTKQFNNFLGIINSSLHYQVGDIGKMPILAFDKDMVSQHVTALIDISKLDWDSCETSWDFASMPLLNAAYHQSTLKATYQKLRAQWREMTLEMQRLEQENNRIFIEAYGLKDELDEMVDLSEITLTCNPNYRYGNNKTEEELEVLLLADTMRELISYAVGCMFGRYALDKPGLILANQGETIADYLKQIPEPSFPADDDNVIPMLDGDWFTDDITDRFRQFLRVAFGEEHYEENLKFVEQALNVKGKREYSIRDYFLAEFYTDHVKRYKKRPIYWLFSSPKGSFNALIYMHRYRPDTVSVVLNDYLREFRTKLTAHKNHLEAVSISASAAQGEKTKALKEIEKINKMIAELEEYEREVLYPLATQQIEIDLDDGVKTNYPKFGSALKKIVGLDAQED
ncbi:BREX-1 system adenine-specific DNA-methyltransferase PglX [Methylomonas koyamae]|uniref:BREX-1 system adenine-specific DNA-methyltransferase PglX n=1 Tax=Methylomonas koyamae TaxID=702114 RepID=UPI000BC3135D|nr:BREX-1 system adenine-specific DNA-methyltransferase PglX [Methylomonas koyamae]ATG92546.1 hypothetical protein MKLM6_4387 [Methylomonas koyamae]